MSSTRTLGMPKFIDFETIGACNRVCPTCIRNSHPDKAEISSWFSGSLLSVDVIRKALDECSAGGFRGGVCLSHYNEPLMDERIAEIAKLAKSYDRFHPIFLNTNGDFITPELAESLDGVLDNIIVSLYMEKSKRVERAEWISSLFKKTRVDACIMSDHIATHYSPKFDVVALAEKHKDHACHETKIRVIINHRRQFLLCCDDVVGNFDLGYFPDITIGEYWLGERHTTIVRDLERFGGRNLYSHCRTCPRVGERVCE